MCFHKSSGALGEVIEQMYEMLLIAPNDDSAVAAAQNELEDIPGAFAKVAVAQEHELLYVQGLN